MFSTGRREGNEQEQCMLGVLEMGIVGTDEEENMS